MRKGYRTVSLGYVTDKSTRRFATPTRGGAPWIPGSPGRPALFCKQADPGRGREIKKEANEGLGCCQDGRALRQLGEEAEEGKEEIADHFHDACKHPRSEMLVEFIVEFQLLKL